MYNHWFGTPQAEVSTQPLSPQSYMIPSMQVPPQGMLVPGVGYISPRMLPTSVYPDSSPYRMKVAPPAQTPQQHGYPNALQPFPGPLQPSFSHHMSPPELHYMSSPQPDFVHVQPVLLEAVAITPIPNPLFSYADFTHQPTEMDPLEEVQELDPNYDYDGDELPFGITETHSEAAGQSGPSSTRGAVNTAAATYSTPAFTTGAFQVNGDEIVYYEPDVGANVTVKTEPATVASPSVNETAGTGKAKTPYTMRWKRRKTKSPSVAAARKPDNPKSSTSPCSYEQRRRIPCPGIRLNFKCLLCKKQGDEN